MIPLVKPLQDFRCMFGDTAAAAERAMAQPEAYAAYRTSYKRDLEQIDKIFLNWNVQPCPMALSHHERSSLTYLAEQLYGIMETTLQMYANGVYDLLQMFPQYILFRPFMRRQLTAWQEYGRYDFIVDKTGTPVFIETNAAMASAYLPTYHARLKFLETAPDFLRVAEMHDEHEPRDVTFGEAVRAMVRSFTADDGAVAILVDENKKYHEVDLIAASLKKAGLRVVIGDVGDLMYSQGYRLSPNGPRIIACFNKFRLFGAQHSWSAGAPERYHTFLEGIASNAFLSINNFACLTIAEDKGIFAAFRTPAVLDALTASQRDFLVRHTPDSYPLGPSAFTVDGAPLLDEVKAQRGEWILKPRNDYRGTGVHSGRDNDAETWSALVDEITAGGRPYLAQRRVDAHMFPVAIAEGDEVVKEDMRLLGGVYYRHMAVSGMVARVSPSEVANVSSGRAYMLPTVETVGTYA